MLERETKRQRKEYKSWHLFGGFGGICIENLRKKVPFFSKDKIRYFKGIFTLVAGGAF